MKMSETQTACNYNMYYEKDEKGCEKDGWKGWEVDSHNW